ncbi:helix-turn-helix domain-containing protein [Dyella caseinilytica]|uniref:Helix-turn-helix transcriptional regulator n=1 Tax=Dyella caseinilytica TaxID=1849581 RepID=A0ABX7GX36_9GAMM|nr:helix-turn-helix transcriptional regulator [Dyella caseinilytica]QRN54977.1 helix-turn-helix transcriptional regulator [Dyella caseinilytica]GFZ98383.1 transcriptional regulator [Dyella caseinilytica]
MGTVRTSQKHPSDDLGLLLRHWREVRGTSQLGLSLDAGVSQRHLSFIESGRSAPSRQVLTSIVQSLDVPLRERNAVFLAAGYAPVYSETPWNAKEMQGITRALDRMLRQHDPFPAMVMDRYWNVLTANESSPRFFGSFIDMAARHGPRNMLHLIFDPDGMRPFVVDWETVARSLVQRVYRETVGRVLDEQTRSLLDELFAYPGVDPSWRLHGSVGSAPNLPMIPLGFNKDGKILSYFSMVTSVGAPQSVAAQELRIESLFPADEETEVFHAKWMSSSQKQD